MLHIQFFKNHNLFIPNEPQIKTEQQREGIWCQWWHRAEQTCVSLLCEHIPFPGHWRGTASVEDPHPRYCPGPEQCAGEAGSSCPRSQSGCQAAHGYRAAGKGEGGGGLSAVLEACACSVAATEPLHSVLTAAPGYKRFLLQSSSASCQAVQSSPLSLPDAGIAWTRLSARRPSSHSEGWLQRPPHGSCCPSPCATALAAAGCSPGGLLDYCQGTELPLLNGHEVLQGHSHQASRDQPAISCPPLAAAMPSVDPGKPSLLLLRRSFLPHSSSSPPHMPLSQTLPTSVI